MLKFHFDLQNAAFAVVEEFMPSLARITLRFTIIRRSFAAVCLVVDSPRTTPHDPVYTVGAHTRWLLNCFSVQLFI